jgi:hypothetical protein
MWIILKRTIVSFDNQCQQDVELLIYGHEVNRDAVGEYPSHLKQTQIETITNYTY